ncbi:MAG: helix-turn-helix transcriptional regulator [Elusimicrobiales bacterium]|nr:helix-turn-helix transcriptional regulator [Elusimicrobiales bacterium]
MKKKYTFNDYLKKQESKDPSFRTKYEHEVQLANIAMQIAHAREEKGMSQDELAKKIHTTQQVISDIERLKYPNMTINTLLKITSALRIHITL